MKNSIDKPKNVVHSGNHSCSEETCATCFANRGCMYEQYLSATIHTMEQLYLQSTSPANTAIIKRA